jgi:hypothetical protein
VASAPRKAGGRARRRVTARNWPLPSYTYEIRCAQDWLNRMSRLDPPFFSLACHTTESDRGSSGSLTFFCFPRRNSQFNCYTAINLLKILANKKEQNAAPLDNVNRYRENPGVLRAAGPDKGLNRNRQ